MVFDGQTITLSLDTDIDITGYDGVILYEKSNGVHGEWVATVSEDTVSYDIQAGDVGGVTGVWKIQAKATMGSDVKFGKITVIEFRTPL